MRPQTVDKIFSGRFLLTVICGLTFAYLACRKYLPNEATMGIITLVFMGYFSRTDRSKEEQPKEGEEKKP